MQETRVQLLEGADVVFFDPTGQPVDQQTSGTQANDSAAETSESTDGAAESSDSAESETQDS